MSNDRPAKKRRLPEIPKLEMRPTEVAATRSVVRGIIRGVEPPVEIPPVILPPAETPPVEIAPPPPVVLEPPLPEIAPRQKYPPSPPHTPHLRTPYEAIDRFRLLKPGPRAVCEEIYRAAAGWHSDECVISIAKLAVYCRIDDKMVRKYVAQLQSLGYIERLDGAQGGDSNGSRFRIYLPRMAPPVKTTPGRNAGGAEVPPYKENALKKDSKSVVCDLCAGMSGHRYVDRDNPQLGVVKCDHGQGK